MSKKELQEALLERGASAEDIALLKTVEQLRNRLAELDDGDIELEEDTSPSFISGGSPVIEQAKPKRWEPAWQSYLTDQFTEKEVFDGRPTVNGLQRLLEKEIGPIVSTTISSFSPPSVENKFFASVGVTVKVLDRDFGYEREATGLADAHYLLAEGVFQLYPSSMAETRAKGRAYKQLLSLYVTCNEEIGKVNEKALANLFDTNDDEIEGVQIQTIRSLMKKAKINEREYLEDCGFESLDEFTKDDAKKAIKHLHKLSKELEESK